MYVIIFIIGTLIGSFASLATYRIPLKQDILIKHSYCPVCEEKLVLKDLIPIFSYIFLGGKCSHCGEKIKIRYLVLEVVSGVLFLLFILSFGLDFFNLDFKEMIFLLFITIFFIVLVIIAGMDKENRMIDTSVTLFGILHVAIYNLYLLCVGQSELFDFLLFASAILVYMVNIYIVENKFYKYIVNFLIVVLLSCAFANIYIVIASFFLSLVTSLVHKSICKNEPPIAYYYIIYFASIFIIYNFIV